eukprot:TRINITY_DN4457_c0_g1_i1.p1 TRINITY_DN4457_c0_g1~~TRINITY_DN4457_c0_g1_i1.p1  ORF type:complete len:607 (-),score=146.06 TRINITY_DN4457_c0_g1_i1:66-1886(-)
MDDPSKPVVKKAKDYWSDNEKAMFCAGLKKFGKNFEQITTMVGTKSKEQTQAYYYRLLKKTLDLIPGLHQKDKSKTTVNAVDSEKDLIAAIVVESLKELKVNGNKRKRGSDDPSGNSSTSTTTTTTTSSLIDLAQTPTSPPSAYPTPSSSPLTSNLEYLPQTTTFMNTPHTFLEHTAVPLFHQLPPVHIPTHLLPNPSSDHIANAQTTSTNTDTATFNSNAPNANTNTTQPTKKTSKKIPLQLTAKSPLFSTCLSQAGHNPKLQLNIKPSKNITYIINYLNSKWTTAGRSVATSPIRLFPVLNGQEQHPGWGIEDSFITVAFLCQMLSSPSLLKLNYGWDTGTVPHYFVANLPTPVSATQASIPPQIQQSNTQPHPTEPEYNIDHFIAQVDNSESGLLLQSPVKVTQQLLTPTKDIIPTNSNSNPIKTSPSSSSFPLLVDQDVLIDASLTPFIEGQDNPFSPSRLIFSPHSQTFSPLSFAHSPSFASPLRARPRVNRARSRGLSNLSNEGVFTEISHGLPPISLSSLFEQEASFDGFGRNNNANPESECKDFYKNFETSISNYPLLPPQPFQTPYHTSPPKNERDSKEPPIFSLLLAESHNQNFIT